MKWFSIFFADVCLQCGHYKPYYYENTLELSTCSKFNQYADMCRMDETKCGKKAKHFIKKDTNNDTNKKIEDPLINNINYKQ